MTYRGRSRADPPQPGNPHALARRQHVFPAKSIARFAREGGVEIHDFVRQKRRRAKPDDPLFCADRAWSHGAETGFMKRIEDAFQKLAEQILARDVTSFDDSQVDVISDFYALWQSRAERRHLPMQYVRPPDTRGTRHQLDADELERLEKGNVIATRPDGSFAMRDLMGSVIYINLDRIKSALAAASWGLVEPLDGHFCVPDVPRHGILPLTPTLALAPNNSWGKITRDNLASINRAMVEHAEEYIFADDLSACPGLPKPGATVER